MTIRDDQGFELVERDAHTGRSVWKYFDGEKTVFRTDYPVENIVKMNNEQRNIARPGWSGDYHQIASIPLNVVHDTGIGAALSAGDDKFLSKWLNDGDNRAWRTKEGKV